MMKHEFEELAGYEVSFETYNNVIEPMYMAVNLSKKDFVKLIDRKAVALPTKGELKREMRKIAAVIFEGCGLRTYHDEENRIDRLAKEYAKRAYGIEWATDMKAYVLIMKDYAYCGVRQDRGCSYPAEVIIGRDGIEYERFALVG